MTGVQERPRDLPLGGGESGVRVVRRHAEVDNVAVMTDLPEHRQPVDELVERGHQDCPMGAARRILRIGRGDQVEPGRLADDLRGEVPVRVR